MSWFTSWLPSLPTINLAVPARLQGRFVSFVLKRTLGHLFKPGQLDSPQIDSQIGSGYVQVNDLELDESAINAYLDGSPLTLETGTVQSVVARIPWPNPLTSTIGVSVKGLHLCFRVNKLARRPTRPDVDLSESVLSVAESFVHDELTEQEEVGLWESIHSVGPSESDDNGIPGGLDPFMTSEEEMHIDPAGVSLFAALIERLLARFEFDAQDIQATLVDPANMTLRFRLGDIRYSTTTPEDAASGTRRTLTFQGIELFSTNHVHFTVPRSPSTTRPSTPPHKQSMSDGSPDSSPSSNSSMDEEVMMNLSQSIAVFPPRPDSPTESTTSSIYHSFIDKSTAPSTFQVDLEGRDAAATPKTESGSEELFLSLGTTPLSIQLTTPPPRASGGLNHDSATAPSQESLRLDIQSGVLAVSIQPWQVLGLIRLIDKLTIVNSSDSSVTQTQDKPLLSLDIGFAIRGVCILISSTFDNDTLDPFFAHPLIPPPITSGYTRIFIESISSNASLTPITQLGNFSIGDLSIFQYLPTSKGKRHRAIPIFFTDPNLPLQYDPLHTHPSNDDPFHASCPQPTIRTVNWRSEKSAVYGNKLSHWRSRPQTHHSPQARVHLETINPSDTFLRLTFESTTITRSRKMPQTAQTARVDVLPIQICIDIESIRQNGGLLGFMQDFSLEQNAYYLTHPNLVGSPQSPTSLSASYDDLPSPSQRPRQPSTDTTDTVFATLSFSMVRISILSPPPPGQQTRSGILVVDLHDISISNRSEASSQVRFNPAISHHRLDEQGILLADAKCRRIVVGCSVANQESTVAFVSVGPLSDDVPDLRGSSLPLAVKVFRPPPNNPQEGNPQMSIHVDVPSVYTSISKPQVDALQIWIDDATQAMERLNAPREPESRGSKASSLIGSRFFTKSQRGSTVDSSKLLDMTGIKTLISLNVTELYVRVHLPRNGPDDQGQARPFNITGSDFNAKLELHANGKLAALVTFMDARIQDTEVGGESRMYLSLTAARSLTSAPRPLIKVRFISSIIPETTAKETKVSLSLANFTFEAYPDIQWIEDLIAFSKAPPGTFESVVPSERTSISVKIVDGSVRAFAPKHPGAVVLSIGGLHFATDIIGDVKDASFRLDIASMGVLAIDNVNDTERQRVRKGETDTGMIHWKSLGYALLAEISSTKLHYQESKSSSPQKQVLVDGTKLKIHACADTFASVGAFGADLVAHFSPPKGEESVAIHEPPAILSPTTPEGSTMFGSIDESAFRKPPEIGPTPDMIYDDLPTNLDYLDESFGTAAGLRELTDDDLDEFDIRDIANPIAPVSANTRVVSSVGGETIKMLSEDGIKIIDDYYDTLPRENIDERPSSENEVLRVRLRESDVSLLLYDGYDWPRTRKAIEEGVREMRKKLAKIRQFVASGQTQEPIPEDTSALLFNSVYIGLHEDVDATQPEALIAAIDNELREDFETGTQSSWQTMQTPIATPRTPATRVQGKKLTRARGSSIEFCLSGVNAELNNFGGNSVVSSRTFVTVRDLEILDHIKTSTWKKFLTSLRSDSKGNIRETGANMVRIELHSVLPAPGHKSEESRLRAKILPLRLYVDQDAVDFLKKFFSFQDPDAAPPQPSGPEKEAYIQMAEIFPIDLKLDYKPRRVDYRALREGKTIELMNFFHFDGAEMTLRHITLSGVTGWPKLFEMLNDLWTPDVKATQLVEVISGVAPIRSVVNVGSGVADLVLLPISQYRKDGRIVRGVQKGTTAFVKSTALEAIKMGAHLATGTQVILEQAEGVLGGKLDTITAETLQPSLSGDDFDIPQDMETVEDSEAISKYAQQPADIKEGVQSAYKSLQRNLSSAAQTILAVPMEVYERSGEEGPVRSVIRAVPIAVLKPMIGATEAISKTLLGLHNTLDPEVRHENEAKYKNR